MSGDTTKSSSKEPPKKRQLCQVCHVLW